MILEEKVESAILGSLDNLGYEIVQIRHLRSQDNTLQIMIDKSGGKITLDDCAKVSRIVSAIMDAEDIISDHYNLEISSPGINRPLVKQGDFIRFKDSEAQFKLKQEYEGTKKINGKIIGIREDQIIIELGAKKKIEICFDNIDSACLV